MAKKRLSTAKYVTRGYGQVEPNHLSAQRTAQPRKTHRQTAATTPAPEAGYQHEKYVGSGKSTP